MIKDHIQLKNEFKKALAELNTVQRTVFINRLHGQKLGELARIMDVSPARIHQIEDTAWIKIQVAFEKNSLNHKGKDISVITERKNGISKRTSKALRKNNIETIRDLFSINKETLPNLKGIGQKSMKEISNVSRKLKKSS